jgi:Cysteine synthase
MIESAEKRGELNPDKIILEATSGNTGIGFGNECRGERLQVMLDNAGIGQ